MKLTNDQKNSERQQLETDVQAWLAKGNKIPLVPIQFPGDIEKSTVMSPQRKRDIALRMLDEGKGTFDTAKFLGLSQRTVAGWRAGK